MVGFFPHGPDFTSPPFCTSLLPPALPGFTARLWLLRGGAKPRPVLLITEGGTWNPFSSCAAQLSSLHVFYPSRAFRPNDPATPHDRFDTYLLSVMGFLLAQVWASPSPAGSPVG